MPTMMVTAVVLGVLVHAPARQQRIVCSADVVCLIHPAARCHESKRRHRKEWHREQFHADPHRNSNIRDNIGSAFFPITEDLELLVVC
jgi:hypothetical protein